ncbi:MAG: hypothetical protein JSU73_11105 [candidate division WOR-3 bacterium]|nr:MAG: hypothetical protein JSU73_11105 [candidate division WOR-3 bacterium]
MRRLWWGIAVLLIGIWVWLSALGVPYISFRQNWPLLIVALGVLVLIRGIRRATRRRRRSARVIIGDVESGRVDIEEAIREMKGE